MIEDDNGESWETLVSAIMITADRPDFVPIAIDCFLAQTYEPKELVIVDDGFPFVDTVQWIEWLKRHGFVEPASIRYVSLSSKISIGAKWNIAVEAALGDHLIFWADDDWHHPERIRKQLTTLYASGAEACALGNVPYVRLTDGERFKFVAKYRRVLDGTYLFTRRFAERGPFPRTPSPESVGWLNNKPAPYILDDERLYLGTIHGSNAWGWYPKDQWIKDVNPKPLPAPIQALVGYPGVCTPNRELIFEVGSFDGEDAVVADWPIADRALYAARKILKQPEFAGYDLVEKIFVVIVEGQAFRALVGPVIVPWEILPLGKELIP